MSGVTPNPSSQRVIARQPYLPPLVILAILAVIGTITFLGPVIKPVLVATFIFFIIQPAAQWLTDRGLSSWLSYLILLFVVLVAGMLLVRVAYQNLYDLQRRIPQYEDRAIELLSNVPGIDVDEYRRSRPKPPIEPQPYKPPQPLTPPASPPTGTAPAVEELETVVPVATPAIPVDDPGTVEPTSPMPETSDVGAEPTTVDGDGVVSDETPLEPELTNSDVPVSAEIDVDPVVPPAEPEVDENGQIFRQALPPREEAPAGEQLEGKTLLELFNVTSEAIGRVLVGTAVEWLEGGLMVLFYLVFIILDAHRLPNRIRRALPETGEKVVEMGEDINQSITDYMRVKTLVSLGMAVTAAMMMAVFRLENWPLWALITFLFNYVTYVGSLGALVPPTVIAFLQFESPIAAGILTLLLCGNRFFWIDYVEIRFAGRKLSINAVLLLVSLAYWGSFWGVTGLVLAVPMLTATKIALETFPSTRNWAILISED
ncbi:MAG: AI-2E family transporter [Planctomycetaceae bacterium]|nr:AI-2E family transporter [Planctomycetaceae bacterium]